MGALLSDAERSKISTGYERNGYALCANLFDAARRASLIAAALRFDGPQKGDFTPLMHPHRTEPLFMDAISDPKVIDVMETVLGGPVQGLQSEFFFGKPGTLGFACHQDNFYVRSNPDTFASIWVALSDVGRRNGGMFMVPGTHRLPLLEVRETHRNHAGNQDVNAHRIECVVPDHFDTRGIDMVMTAGTGAVFHGHTVHGSHDNSADRWRYALLLTYVAEGAPFRPGNYSKRRRVDVRAKCEIDG